MTFVCNLGPPPVVAASCLDLVMVLIDTQHIFVFFLHLITILALVLHTLLLSHVVFQNHSALRSTCTCMQKTETENFGVLLYLSILAVGYCKSPFCFCVQEIFTSFSSSVKCTNS